MIVLPKWFPAVCIVLALSACSKEAPSGPGQAGQGTAGQGDPNETLEQLLVRRAAEATIFIAENQREPESPVMVALCEALQKRGVEFQQPIFPHYPYYLNRLVPTTRRDGKVWLVFDHHNARLSKVLAEEYLADHKVEFERVFPEATAVLVTNEFVGDEPQLIGLEAVCPPGVVTTNIVFTPDDQYMFVTSKTGVMRWFEMDGNGGTTGKHGEAMRLRKGTDDRDGIFYGGESGLVGMALHPNFAENHKLYLHYNWRLMDGSRSAVVSEWVADLSRAPDRISVDSERRLLTIEQEHDNHNAGCLLFGPDGYLYIGVGDGEVGQWTLGRSPAGSLRGKVLRIDVDSRSDGKEYGIPADNPFVADAGFPPETWAWGFRNPWRLAFVPDGRLIASDIGEDVNEELTFVVKGRHHGWPYFEGLNPRNPWTLDAELQPPLLPYGRASGMSVIAGRVYQDRKSVV